MAIAIAERMRQTFPGVRLVVPPQFGAFEARARHGFLTTWEFPGRFRSKLMLGSIRLGSAGIRSALGIINPAEVDIVLDASGFAFSDQWGPGAACRLLRKMNHPSRRHQPLLLLPQAFGPFTDQEVAKWTRRLLDRASLVCARDGHSLKELNGLHHNGTIRQFPDFTAGLESLPSKDIDLRSPFVAIVPNKRMLDKGASATAYLKFLEQAIGGLGSRGLNPVFVLHHALHDQEVIGRIQQNGGRLPVLTHDDPRVLKWMLGQASFVIGSRFHALVSALSQGVPCIGTGWSHKYPELFADFDCPDFLIGNMEEQGALDRLFERLETPKCRREQTSLILAAAARMKERNELMWREIETIIRRHQPDA